VIQITRNKVLALVPVAGLSFAPLTLSASPGHGYVSVSAAAFRPTADGYDFTNDGNYVINLDDSSLSWIAPVQLPNGATVTKVTFYWNDTHASLNAYLHLKRVSWDAPSAWGMATASSTGDGGWGSSEDPSIIYSDIDSSQCGYYLQADLPKTATQLHSVIIEYSYPVSLPLVVRNLQTSLGGR
jgi:hypothetical protein